MGLETSPSMRNRRSIILPQSQAFFHMSHSTKSNGCPFSRYIFFGAYNPMRYYSLEKKFKKKKLHKVQLLKFVGPLVMAGRHTLCCQAKFDCSRSHSHHFFFNFLFFIYTASAFHLTPLPNSFHLN